jgi:hypothetical protein
MSIKHLIIMFYAPSFFFFFKLGIGEMFSEPLVVPCYILLIIGYVLEYNMVYWCGIYMLSDKFQYIKWYTCIPMVEKHDNRTNIVTLVKHILLFIYQWRSFNNNQYIWKLYNRVPQTRKLKQGLWYWNIFSFCLYY